MFKYKGFRLFGVGDSDGVLTGSDYGDYTLVVAITSQLTQLHNNSLESS